MRVLVTGSSGFLGRRLINVLLAAGHDVTAVTRNPKFSSKASTYVIEDALAAREYASIVSKEGVETIINTLAAGVDPLDRDISRLICANSMFPAALALEASKAGAKTIIQIGSSAEYAPSSEQRALRESDPLTLQKMYGATKAAGSVLFSASAEEVGLNFAVLRLFNIFGAGENPHRLFPSLVRRLVNGEDVPLSNGTQMRDFLHVDDASKSILRMATALQENRELSGTYNLASGKALSVRDFALSVTTAVGADPGRLKFGQLPMRPDDLPYVVGDASRLNSVIGPNGHTSISDAVTPLLAGFEIEDL